VSKSRLKRLSHQVPEVKQLQETIERLEKDLADAHDQILKQDSIYKEMYKEERDKLARCREAMQKAKEVITQSSVYLYEVQDEGLKSNIREAITALEAEPNRRERDE
jgi:septum formation inhibitor MinC